MNFLRDSLASGRAIRNKLSMQLKLNLSFSLNFIIVSLIRSGLATVWATINLQHNKLTLLLSTVGLKQLLMLSFSLRPKNKIAFIELTRLKFRVGVRELQPHLNIKKKLLQFVAIYDSTVFCSIYITCCAYSWSLNREIYMCSLCRSIFPHRMYIYLSFQSKTHFTLFCQLFTVFLWVDVPFIW